MALLNLGLGNAVTIALASFALYLVGYVIYNLFLHPLRRYPGPLLMRATRMTYCYRHITGTLPFIMPDLHRRYGSVVRVAPDELAFADPAAWKEIMCYRTGGAEFEKSPAFYRPVTRIPPDISNAPKEEHSLLRRTLAHGFSEKSLREQQPIISGYIDLLMRRLREHSEGGRAVDMAAWYNFTTFDIIGDLAFGESFGCLDNSNYHPWVKAIFMLARTGAIFQSAAQYPWLLKLLLSLIPASAWKERERHNDLTKAKVIRRMESGKERPDIIEGLLRKREELDLTVDKLQATSSIIIIGGSETTATLLSGVTYLLLTNPSTLVRLNEEIRGAFQSEDEINFSSVSVLPYLLACLDEALRVYPPVPSGLPRVVPKGGATICGNFVPEKNIVAIHQWALYRDEKNFKDPLSYRPERWLGDPDFASDNREAFQPFHLGSRNCIGKNLAYIEMRVILARMLWNFDMELAEESLGWTKKQRFFNLWEKGPLYIRLKPIR